MFVPLLFFFFLIFVFDSTVAHFLKSLIVYSLSVNLLMLEDSFTKQGSQARQHFHAQIPPGCKNINLDRQLSGFQRHPAVLGRQTALAWVNFSYFTDFKKN